MDSVCRHSGRVAFENHRPGSRRSFPCQPVQVKKQYMAVYNRQSYSRLSFLFFKQPPAVTAVLKLAYNTLDDPFNDHNVIYW